MNRQGVRIGSSEIYEVVEQLEDVVDSLVVGVELKDGGYWMPLFVVPRNAPTDVDALTKVIRDTIRVRVSPRHVPDDVIIVDRLPHTRTGKKLEVPVKRILQGADAATVINPQAIDDPSALDNFQALRARSPARSGR